MLRAIGVGLGLLGLTACLPPGRIVAPASPHAVAWEGNSAGVYEAEVKAVADAGLAIGQQDRGAGVIQTQWHETYHGGYSPLAPPTRRIMFILSPSQSQVVIMPKLELCDANGICHPSDRLTDKELVLSESLSASVQNELQARGELVARNDVVLQSGPAPIVVATPPPAQAPQIVYVPAPQGPARPDQKGPVEIRTRVAGMQEIVAGREVEIELSNGNRMTGKIAAVSPDGLLLDAGTGDTVVVWAKDIAQVITR